MLEQAPEPPDPSRSAEEAAASVDLVYCSDAEPGIRRRRSGAGFSYIREGRRVVDAKTLDRIGSLAVPPAWTDVWIATDAACHIQATGRDARGRKQYRYHPRWTACRDEVKYASLVEFAEALPGLRKTMDADLRRRGLPREKVVGVVVWLLDNAMIRVGNAAYARDNKSFGLTTLRDRHVDIDGATLRFTFRGKSGKEWRLRLTDRRVARVVKGAQDLPGQHLFQYLDDEGGRRAVGSQDVNAYIHENAGEAFSSKHFRTWGGTVRAAEILAEVPTPPARREAARVLNGVVDAVAARLGNTRAVCRGCYIHPRVIEAWSEGRLADELAGIRRRFRRSPDGLDREEAVVLRWLQAGS
jgi:DNA topoisomerase-1